MLEPITVQLKRPVVFLVVLYKIVLATFNIFRRPMEWTREKEIIPADTC